MAFAALDAGIAENAEVGVDAGGRRLHGWLLYCDVRLNPIPLPYHLQDAIALAIRPGSTTKQSRASGLASPLLSLALKVLLFKLLLANSVRIVSYCTAIASTILITLGLRRGRSQA